MTGARLGIRPGAVYWSGVGIATLGFVATAAQAASRGGYFPESWAWLAWLTILPAAVILIAARDIRLGRLDLAFLGLLFAYGSWALLSSWWSLSATRTVFEAQRTLAYLGIALFALLIVRRRTAPFLVGGVLAGVTVIAGYAFLTRVLPDRFAQFDPIAGYRLSDPIGYWNGLGIFAAMGVLLALGFAARAHSSVARGVASAIPVVLVATLFFTFSRGAWIGLAAGLMIAIAFDPHRFQLVAATIVLAPWSILGVWLCSRSHALTTIGSSLSDATGQGRSLLLYLAILSAVSGICGFAFAEAGRKVQVGVRVSRSFAALLVIVAVGSLIGIWVKEGSPVSIVSSAWDRFAAPPEVTEGPLTDRLFDLSSSGRVDLWAVSIDDFVAQPLRGTGAGTFAYSWAARRPTGLARRDAHSLYLETMGELGAVGLTLILGALAVPLAAAAARARHSSVLPGAVAAFGAYIVHAGIDWDWELSGVTLVALTSGIGLIVAARPNDTALAGRRLATGLTPVAVALSLLAFVSVLGNVPLGHARDALNESDYVSALADARRARTLAPWSAEPLRIIGEAQFNAGDLPRARASFLTALKKEPGNWELWVDLALATDGAERRAAVERARQLNPLSTQVRQLLEEL
jgi:hypothetical protein